MKINKALSTSVAGGLALLGAAVAIVIGVYFLFKSQPENAVRLPLLAIGGVIALLVVIALVAGAYTLFDLADPKEALGLPEGSVRAIIALSLIVMFAILTVYLYSDISRPPVVSLANLSQAELEKFLTSVPNERVITTLTTATPNGDRFTVYYHDGSAAGNDFAKQLLVMIGTLMTSVTSFYFATRPGSSASSSSSSTATPAPELTSVTPRQGAIGSTLGLEIAGNNLGEVNEVKLTRGNQELTATDLGVSARLLECNVALPTGTEEGEWTIRVTDKFDRTAELKNAISLRQG